MAEFLQLPAQIAGNLPALADRSTGKKMEYQIILLPKRDYWEWVRSCRGYVLTYGANMTSDPAMAGRYMTPRQVVTFPAAPGSFSEADDMAGWFSAQYPGVRVDPVNAANPGEFEAELTLRIESHDRYGQKRRPFYLLWPTDYPVVTQRFGANPQIYSRFGVPAHEGLDIRALTNTNVYACFDGVVYEVHTNRKDHPYGLHVRIRHRDGYKTVYAHLAKALVGVGEQVVGGQIIGKADSTGASAGAHLHLTLKQDGATARGETTYPKDILDPTPFMVWPEDRVRKSSKAAAWAAERCLLGVHGRVGGALREVDLQALHSARAEAVMLPMQQPEDVMARLRGIHPGMLVAVRLSADLTDEPVTAEQFVGLTSPHVERWARAGVSHFEVSSNPNLQREGWRRSWHSGTGFATWFATVLDRLRRVYPEGSFGFPGLAPGDTVSGQRANASDFLMEAEAVAQTADWIGVNCFWTTSAGPMSEDGVGRVEDYRRLFPDRLVLVTEFGNASPGTPAQEKANQYLDFFNALRNLPGVGAAFAYALSAESGHGELAWLAADQTTSPIADAIGKRRA